MTMNSSGPISLAGTTAGVSIEIENGGNGTTQISLNDAAVRSLAGVPSGAITMPTNFYGKANQFNYTIAANTTNLNLRTGAIAAGWNQSSKLVATINSGVYVYSTSTGSYSLTINGSFPGGLTLVNNGTIVGKGGNGGDGNYVDGTVGGPALLVQSAVTINNGSGNIAGGGGGGGGGASYTYCSSPCGKYSCCGYSTSYGGGGGGGAGLGSPGGGGSGASAGTLTAGGSGGYPGGGGATNYQGYGGSGGGWGSSGANGCSGNYGGGCGAPAGRGGAAGACLVGNSYITWTATGNRYGSIS